MSQKTLQNIMKTKDKISKSKPSRAWADGLVHAMKDPTLFVSENNDIVVIRDKFPKAKYHFLIIPKKKTTDMFQLNKSHIPLLKDMMIVAESIKNDIQASFKIGFHSVPSMHRLHLHVISDDFVSPYLKSKKHWNSFTTDFFIKAEDLIKKIEDGGHVEKMAKSVHEDLMKTSLKCHKCDYVPKYMPNLKEHLLSHL